MFLMLVVLFLLGFSAFACAIVGIYDRGQISKINLFYLLL